MKARDPNWDLTPELLEELMARQTDSATKSRRKREFYYFLPEGVMKALRKVDYAPAWGLAMAIYKGWYRDFRKRNPVKLTSVLLTEFGISKGQKQRGLKRLEQTELFVVERSPRRNPRVMMTWILPKD